MKLFRAIALATLAAAFSSAPAWAVPIRIAYNPVLTQPANNGDATVKAWAESAIETYIDNQYAGYEQLPVLGDLEFKITKYGTGDKGDIPCDWPSFGAGVGSITLPLGNWDYIVLSWGNSKIPNDNGTADILYYVGGTTGSYTFKREFAKGGLSSISVYGRVPRATPETSMTLGLLGLGLLMLASIRRFVLT